MWDRKTKSISWRRRRSNRKGWDRGVGKGNRTGRRASVGYRQDLSRVEAPTGTGIECSKERTPDTNQAHQAILMALDHCPTIGEGVPGLLAVHLCAIEQVEESNLNQRSITVSSMLKVQF